MKSFIWIPVACLAGLIIGAWGPREELRDFKDNMKNQAMKEGKWSASRSVVANGFQSFTRLANIQEETHRPHKRRSDAKPLFASATNKPPTKVASTNHAPAAASANPWPTHAPGATPYVHTMSETAPAPEPQEGEVFETMEDLWDSIYERFGHFYSKKDELEMFRELPQNDPYSFVPHSPRDVLDEGEAMRTAKLFAALEGVDARVIAMHQIVDGLDDWGFMTVLTMTPARLFELSEQVDEMYMFEQFYPSV